MTALVLLLVFGVPIASLALLMNARTGAQQLALAAAALASAFCGAWLAEWLG